MSRRSLTMVVVLSVWMGFVVRCWARESVASIGSGLIFAGVKGPQPQR